MSKFGLFGALALVVMIVFLSTGTVPVLAQGDEAMMIVGGDITANPLFVPLVLVSIVAALGWVSLAGLVFGWRGLVELAFESFPKDSAVEVIDKFYRYAQATSTPYDDIAAHGARGLIGRYDEIEAALSGSEIETAARGLEERLAAIRRDAAAIYPTDIDTGKMGG